MTDANITMLPMTRFNIQMPRTLKRERTLFTKKVIPNHHNNAPTMIAKYPNNWKPIALPGIPNEKRANKPMNKKIINGLESVTKKAVMKL